MLLFCAEKIILSNKLKKEKKRLGKTRNTTELELREEIVDISSFEDKMILYES